MLEENVERLDDAHQRATARAAQPLRRLIRTEDGEALPDAATLQIVKEHVPRHHMRALPRETLLGDDEGVLAVIHRAHFIPADERERQRFFRQILVTTAVAANILWRRDRSGRGSSVELDEGSRDGERVTAAAAHAVAELNAITTERGWQLDRQACGRMRGSAPSEGMPRAASGAREHHALPISPALVVPPRSETGRAFNFTTPRFYVASTSATGQTVVHVAQTDGVAALGARAGVAALGARAVAALGARAAAHARSHAPHQRGR